MKKTFSIVLILALLCGCGNSKESIAISNLNNKFGVIINSIKDHRTNNNTKYYSFYLPSDVQELEYDDNYHRLVFEASDFVMNLNVNYVLCEKYFSTELDYPFSFIGDYVIYQIDNLDSMDDIKFNFCLYNIDNNYLFSLYTNRFNFFGTTNIEQVDELVLHLFEIVLNSKLNVDSITNDYYLGTVFDYDKPQLNLISQHFQPSGDLRDLLIDKETAQQARERIYTEQDLSPELDEAEEQLSEDNQ